MSLITATRVLQVRESAHHVACQSDREYIVTRLIWSNDGSDPSDLRVDRRRSGSCTATPGPGWHAMRAGETAPHFRLYDQHSRRVTLSELLLRGAVVLRFCRNENTPASIPEFCSLSELHVEVEQLGATLAVIAVEPLDPRPFDKDAASFPFPILSDEDGDVAQSYGLTYEVFEKQWAGNE
jgi:peroxiredoxin